jgi:hypothetical protein
MKVWEHTGHRIESHIFDCLHESLGTMFETGHHLMSEFLE